MMGWPERRHHAPKLTAPAATMNMRTHTRIQRRFSQLISSARSNCGFALTSIPNSACALALRPRALREPGKEHQKWVSDYCTAKNVRLSPAHSRSGINLSFGYSPDTIHPPQRSFPARVRMRRAAQRRQRADHRSELFSPLTLGTGAQGSQVFRAVSSLRWPGEAATDKDLTEVLKKTGEIVRQSRPLPNQSERVMQRYRQELDGLRQSCRQQTFHPDDCASAMIDLYNPFTFLLIIL